MCKQWVRRPEEGWDPLELELWVVSSYHVGTGN